MKEVYQLEESENLICPLILILLTTGIILIIIDLLLDRSVLLVCGVLMLLSCAVLYKYNSYKNEQRMSWGEKDN